MKSFLTQHQNNIQGTLTGFDRVRFRGTLRSICFDKGFFKWFCFLKQLLVAFQAFCDGTTGKLKAATERLAKTTPVGQVVYLAGTRDKQEVVENLIREHNVDAKFTGLIAVLSCVENCRSFELHKNGDTKKLEIQSAYRKCLHYYLYLRHPRFGLMHIRIMTWFPMTVQICMNGREWLARELDAAGIAYERRDNCFTWIADFAKAQELFDEQLQTDWETTFSELLREVHPEFAQLRTELQLRDYYWTSEQTEVATDVAFRSAAVLQPLYRRLVRHAIENLSSPDVMRFLQQKLTKSGAIHGKFQGEIVSDLKTRHEGTRVKHRLGANSVKMYDKFGVVLRVETTIHDAEGLKVYRPKADDSETLAWQPLRRGVADLYRRCELSRKSNESYLEAMSVVECPATLESLALPVSESLTKGGRRYRGLNVLSLQDRRLLQVVNRGEYGIAGFRNRDVRKELYGSSSKAAESKKQSGQVTRSLQLLRAHGLIEKVSKSHRYRVTERGRQLTSAVLYANDCSLKTLSQQAAENCVRKTEVPA